MSISEKFSIFNNNIKIKSTDLEKIRNRYRQITKNLNKEFWGIESETLNSLYVGSYGRDTDIHTSDIDILFQLPYAIYVKYNEYNGNGQSALLQAVRSALQKTYPNTHIKGDGQIIGIKFSDGISFEIVPCFINTNGSYTYQNTNNGGSWKITNPKPEIQTIKDKNKAWNYNLKRLCRMTRSWKIKHNIPMGGLLIDTLAHNFLSNWEYRDKSFVYYDWMIRDFFKFLKDQDKNKKYWFAVGSNQYVYRHGNFEYKAKQAYHLSLEAILYGEKYPYLATSKWKEIFGSKFTG
jgi:hypothetical protein